MRTPEAPSDLAEMDFPGYGEHATVPHLQDSFSQYSMITFEWNKENSEQTADKLSNAVLGNWISFLELRILSYRVKIRDL